MNDLLCEFHSVQCGFDTPNKGHYSYTILIKQSLDDPQWTPLETDSAIFLSYP
jgi:hypothetical protein